MKHFSIYLALLLIATFSLQADVEPVKPIDTDADGYFNISTLEHLCWLSTKSYALSYNYELDNDINAADTKNWNDGKGWLPIGRNSNEYFTGSFDGHHHVIDSLYINSDDKLNLGFFGVIDGSYKKRTHIIKNLGITNCNFTGNNKGYYVGGLAGMILGGVTIDSCFVTGTITATEPFSLVGGLVVWNRWDNIIRNSYTNVKISSIDVEVSGFIARNTDSGNIIENCYSIADITVQDSNTIVGGLCGTNFYNSTEKNPNVFNNCFAYTNVIAAGDNFKVGGLMGEITSYGDGVGEYGPQKITNCYAVCKVNGTENSTVTALMSGDVEVVEMLNCFWDTDVSGITESVVGIGKTTVEMKTKSTFTDADWDFETIWNIDGITNDGYPFLDARVVAVTENILPTTNLTCSPNPCSTTSKIGYYVNNAGFVNITVYDMLCNEVAILVNNYQAAGEHEIIFNAEELSAGVYFVSINSAGTVETGKIIVAR